MVSPKGYCGGGCGFVEVTLWRWLWRMMRMQMVAKRRRWATQPTHSIMHSQSYLLSHSLLLLQLNGLKAQNRYWLWGSGKLVAGYFGQKMRRGRRCGDTATARTGEERGGRKTPSLWRMGGLNRAMEGPFKAPFQEGSQGLGPKKGGRSWLVERVNGLL